MKILITGKNGQVGYELARSLQVLGGLPMEIIVLDRSQMDLANPAQLRHVIREVQPALIVNPAAYTAVDLAESEPDLAMRINGEAVGIIAQEAANCGAALVHYSTDYVFNGKKDGPYEETDAPCPVNTYGRTKLAGEQAILDSGVAHLILRTSWVYGTRGKNFLKTIERLAAERDELRIVADQIGAPTWCRTIAQQTAHAIEQLCNIEPQPPQTTLHLSESPERSESLPLPSQALQVVRERWMQHGGIYHLAAQGHTSWYGFASEIVARGPRSQQVQMVPIRTEDYPVPAPRPRNSQLSCSRFIRRFGELPTWEAALAACMQSQ